MPDARYFAAVHSTAELIDVMWLHKGEATIASAFEVEKSTSICCGILRLTAMALSRFGKEDRRYLVAQSKREKEIICQPKRPIFQRPDDFSIGHILFEELDKLFETPCKLGDDYQILNKVACRCAARPHSQVRLRRYATSKSYRRR